MKYLKVTIQESGSQMTYPSGYQTDIGNYAVDHLYYDATPLDSQSELLVCILDKDYKTSMLRTGVVEITEAQAKAISEANEKRTEIILDEAKVRRLEIKSQLGLTLTTEELDSLDPAKAGAAFSVSKILADRITDLASKGG